MKFPGRRAAVHLALASLAVAQAAIALDGDGSPTGRSVGDRYAGLRVSSIPFSPFPPPSFFIETAGCMTTKAPATEPVLVWIVSLYWGDGEIGLNFPNPTGEPQPFMNFASTDRNEAHLDAFDAAGVKVWLQVEPGDASVDDLIDIVLGQYAHHPCVIGFGVDVEWLNPTVVGNGRAVTDAEAAAWNARVKSRHPQYRLFLKHYLWSKMPPTVRDDILFVDDSQGFSSLNAMVNEFKAWGHRFSTADVGFQFGYPNDRPWWSTFADPAGTITAALDQAIPNATTFLWVDFTIEEIVPLGAAPQILQNPTSQVVAPGAQAVFQVTAEGEGELSYQWEFNGSPIADSPAYAGTNTAALTISGANASVVGEYRCVVSSGCGSTLSAAATLSLRLPGDYDSDGDVDLADLSGLAFCLKGPVVIMPAGHFCRDGDANGDRHIDLTDFAAFQRAFAQGKAR